MSLFFEKCKEKILTVVLITLVVLLIGSNAFTAYFLYQRARRANNSQEPLSASSNQQTKGVEVDNETSGETIVSAPDNTSNVETIKPIIDSTMGAITVAWKEWPVQASIWDILDSEVIDKFIIAHQFTVYNVGKIKEGAYKDKDLFVITYREEGPAFRDTMFRVIKTDKAAVILTKYSDKPYGIYETVFAQNNNVSIKNLEPPQVINIPNSTITFVKTAQEPFLYISAYKDAKPLFKYNSEHYVYKDEDKNCFIVEAPDGTVREYYFDLKFVAKGGERGMAYNMPTLLNIQWLDGSNNKAEYIFRAMGSCGLSGCYSYAKYIDYISQLKKAGRTNTGDPLYELADKFLSDLDAKTGILKNIYDSYYPGWDESTKTTQEKVAFDEFLQGHPLVFWQDPFGNFIEFKNAKYVPAVECGKPVIYLYPEKESDVFVWVNPTGGFKITEPAYNDGWLVKAKPNGEIYNYGDNKIYPYLFWEGYGLNYQRPQEGFVVSKDEVKEFLNEKLIKLGLIKKEADEFIEFWLPKMQEKPYYFITFVPQAEFDELAPLAVSPKPDTVIRVFMDYEGLDEHREVEAQKIITPERKGFIVAEWGGVMHK